MNDLEELQRKQQKRGTKDRASTSSDTALTEGAKAALKAKDKTAVGRTLSANYSETKKGKEPARNVPSIKITVF